MFGRSNKNVTPKNPVMIDVAFEQKISRLFIFRCLWVIAIAIPFAVYSIWFGLLTIVHFFHMLLLGERSRAIFDRQMEYIRYMLTWHAYLRFFTNHRPDVLPW